MLAKCALPKQEVRLRSSFTWYTPQPWNQIQNINIHVIIPSTLRLLLELMQDCTINISIYLMMSDQLISQMCTFNCLSQMQLTAGLICSFRQNWCFFYFYDKMSSFITICHDLYPKNSFSPLSLAFLFIDCFSVLSIAIHSDPDLPLWRKLLRCTKNLSAPIQK